MKIKVVLLEDIKGVGQKYEVKDLAVGYVRNFLLPKKMVEPATKEALKKMEARKEIIKKEEEELRQKMKQLAVLKDLVFYLNVGPNQEIYNSLGSGEIEEELKNRGFSNIEVKLERPIKELGEKEIEISLGKNIKGKIKISIQSLSK